MPETVRSPHPDAIPKAEAARIPEGKVAKYLLDPLHKVGRHKARVFKSVLGFGQPNANELEKAILTELPYHQATRASDGKWGTKYEVSMPITGPNGSVAEVLTVWIVRAATEPPEMVTARVVRGRRP